MRSTWVLVLAPTLGALLFSPNTEAAEPRTSLRLAHSQDGLSFSEPKGLFLASAEQAELTTLPNGEILAVFWWAPKGKPAGLYAAKSTDGGASWTTPRPTSISGLPASQQIGSPEMLVTPSGLLRMYFVTGGAAHDGSRTGSAVGSAVTRDGVNWQLDPEVRIACEPADEVRIAAFTAAGGVSVYASSISRGPDGKPAKTLICRYTSRDGRSFRPAERRRDEAYPLEVFPLDRGAQRMLIATPKGIMAAVSPDGRRWRPDDARIEGLDATVTATSEGGYLMLVSTPGPARDSEKQLALAAKAPAKAGEKAADGTSASPGPRAEQDGSRKAVAAAVRIDKQPPPPNAPADEGTDASSDSAAADPWAPFSPLDPAVELGQADTPQVQAAEAPTSADGRAPLPDFRNPVDYYEWFMQHHAVADVDNALMGYLGLKDKIASWDPKDCIDDDKRTPGPWNPAEHPEWETSYQANRELVEKFMAAAADSRPYSSIHSNSESLPEDGPRLMGTLLPSLSMMRNLARSTLAAAWRSETGEVNPEAMTKALKAACGNARQLREDNVLIGVLVGNAVQNRADTMARWALQLGVFKTEKQLQSAIEALETAPSTDDNVTWVTLERDAMLEGMQYLFVPEANGEPALDLERAERLLSMSTVNQWEEDAPELTADDARAAAQAYDTWSTQLEPAWKTGYPLVKGEDIENLTTPLYETNVLTRAFMPNLRRAYEIKHQTMASHRATLLGYHLALYKQQKGDYPASLDDLPVPKGDDPRIDPFTGAQFGYKVEPSGPTIYTAGRNATDDGGKHASKWTAETDGGSDDYVFWPPQK